MSWGRIAAFSTSPLYRYRLGARMHPRCTACPEPAVVWFREKVWCANCGGTALAGDLEDAVREREDEIQLKEWPLRVEVGGS